MKKLGLIFLMLFLTATVSAVNLDINSVTYSPTPTVPGQYFDLWIVVKAAKRRSTFLGTLTDKFSYAEITSACTAPCPQRLRARSVPDRHGTLWRGRREARGGAATRSVEHRRRELTGWRCSCQRSASTT